MAYAAIAQRIAEAIDQRITEQISMSHQPDAKTTVRPSEDILKDRVERGGISPEVVRKEFERRRNEKQMDKERSITLPAPRGWECGRCGRVNAPFVSQCPCWVGNPPPTWVPTIPPIPINPPWVPYNPPIVPNTGGWPPFRPFVWCNAAAPAPTYAVRMVRFGG